LMPSFRKGWLACSLLVGGLGWSQVPDSAARLRLARHAALFRLGSADSSSSLEYLEAHSSGPIELSITRINDYMSFDPPHSAADDLAQLVKSCDVVAVGTTTRQDSALNFEHTFVYSDWQIDVTRVLKNASSVPVRAGSAVTAVRAGGSLTVDGRLVTAHDSTIPDLTLNHTYVLFMEALPETSSMRSGIAFDVTGKFPVFIDDPRNPTSLRQFERSPVADFLTALERSLQ